jgi:hypothetical protein
MLAGALYLLGYAPYLWYVLRDQRAKPHWAPWLIFSAVETIALCEMRASDGADNWQIWSSMIGSWATFFASVIYGQPELRRLDAICLIFAFAGMIVWQVYGQLMLGLIMSLTAVAFGMIPIIQSAWQNPEGEDKRGWTLFWASCVFATFAIPK